MRERHELDELFRRGLHDAEAEPPARVRAALADTRGWQASALWGWTWWMPLLLVGLSGAGLLVVLGGTRTTAPMNVAIATPATATVLGESPGSFVVGDGMTPGDGVERAALHTTARGDAAPILVATATEAPMPHGRTDEQEAVTPIGPWAAATTHTSEQRDVATSSALSPVPPTAQAYLDISLEDQTEPGPTLVGRLNPLAGPSIAVVLNPIPLTASWRADYVPSKRHAWLSVHGAAGTLKGRWSGPDALERTRAERWTTGWQVGLLGGVEWRSGFGVGVGVSWAQAHSLFNHTDHNPSTTQLTIDTNWIQTTYGTGPQQISTWVVDSLWSVTPGPEQRYRSHNRYTSLWIPLQLHWMGGLRRLRYGVLAGGAVGFPLGRTGHTLVTGDEGARVVRLDDRRMDARPVLNGFAGLMIGHQLGGSTLLMLEPLWQGGIDPNTPLAEGPALRHLMVRLRLVHEIPFTHARTR